MHCTPARVRVQRVVWYRYLQHLSPSVLLGWGRGRDRTEQTQEARDMRMMSPKATQASSADQCSSRADWKKQPPHRSRANFMF